MLKLSYIYDLFYTKIDKKIKDEKIKEPQLSQLMKVTKLELFKYLFDKRRNYEIQNKTENTISFKLKDEIDGDIYFKHHPSVFVQILKTSRLNRLFIRTKMNDNDNAVDISTITGFIEDHSDDVYTLIVDDWNGANERDGTKEALDALGHTILARIDIITRWDGKHPDLCFSGSDWHNGYLLAVVSKK